MTIDSHNSCRLYYSPDSANLIVRMVLEELRVPYLSTLVDRAADEHRSEAYRRLNPQGLIPVLVDGDSVLFETAAIVLHLVDRHAALAPGPGAAGRGELYKWLFFLSNTLHADLRVAFYSHRYHERPECQPGVRAAARSRVIGHFELLDGVIARHGGPWLLEWGLSVCDFYLAACARWSVLYPPGEGLKERRPVDFAHLRRLLELLEQRPAVAEACRKEGIADPFFTDPKPARPKEGSVL
jgi:glutathione S-transferase